MVCRKLTNAENEKQQQQQNKIIISMVVSFITVFIHTMVMFSILFIVMIMNEQLYFCWTMGDMVKMYLLLLFEQNTQRKKKPHSNQKVSSHMTYMKSVLYGNVCNSFSVILSNGKSSFKPSGQQCIYNFPIWNTITKKRKRNNL